MNKTDCDEWKRRPDRNPLTNRQIKIGGPTYTKIAKDCSTVPPKPVKPPVAKPPVSTSICDEWRLKPLINPRSHRVIKRDGPTFNKLAAECRKVPVKTKNECVDWKKDMTKDPINKTNLVFGSQRFDKLARECGVTFPVEPPINAPDFLENRTKVERDVVREINNIDVSQWDMCITGKQSKFRSQLVDVVLLGYGSFGQVYKTKIGSNSVVIKEAYLRPEEKILLLRNVGRKREKIPKNSYPEEFTLLSLVRQLIRQDICPNFLYAYDVSVCEGCVLRNGPGFCYITFMEPADGDLYSYTKERLHTNVMVSMLYQMLLAVHSLHTNLAIIHKDIKSDNFLIKRVNPGGWLKYTIRNSVFDETFYVENTGIIVLLSDLGVSETFHPLYSKSSYTGVRNAEVVREGQSVKFQPITCKKYVVNKTTLSDNVEVVKWADGTLSTRNRTFATIPMDVAMPNIPVDLQDFVKFPAFEFFYDIMDVIHMFTGEKRMLNNGNHSGFKNINPSLLSILRAVSTEKFLYDKRNVRSIVAAEMLNTIYKIVSKNVIPGNIVGQYQSI